MGREVYKIRRKSSGAYSNGGCNPKFFRSGNGKTWSTLGHLKAHLTLVRDSGPRGTIDINVKKERVRQIYADCEIVVFRESSTIKLEDLI